MAGGMWHVETFAPRGDASVLASFLKEELLPYMRSRGFNVKVFLTQYALGPDQFWLLTEPFFGTISGSTIRSTRMCGAYPEK